MQVDCSQPTTARIVLRRRNRTTQEVHGTIEAFRYLQTVSTPTPTSVSEHDATVDDIKRLAAVAGFIEMQVSDAEPIQLTNDAQTLERYPRVPEEILTDERKAMRRIGRLLAKGMQDLRAAEEQMHRAVGIYTDWENRKA